MYARICGGPIRWLLAGAALLGILGLLVATSAAGAAPATVVRNGPRDAPKVALTFDDNYRPERALPTLRALHDLDAPATIFVVGSYVRQYPGINRAIVEGGFEVGDHTLGHPLLTTASWPYLIEQIGGGTRSFQEMTGVRTAPLFRPPYGGVNALVAQAAGANGFRFVVLWDVDTNDWRGYSAATIRNHVLRNTRNGSIILFHLSAAHTHEAIPGIVTGLRARGFELVTVSELLKGKELFLDVSGSTPAGRAISRVVGAGIMSGYNRSYFGPADPITRAQFAKVAVLAGHLHTPEVEKAGVATFADVPTRYDKNGNPLVYPFDYVEEAAAAGILEGRRGRDGSFLFHPAETLTRVQLAQVLARMVAGIKGYSMTAAAEGDERVSSDVPEYAASEVRLVASLGLMKGYSDGTFRPWAKAQRSHVALVVNRYLDLEDYRTPETEDPPPADEEPVEEQSEGDRPEEDASTEVKRQPAAPPS